MGFGKIGLVSIRRRVSGSASSTASRTPERNRTKTHRRSVAGPPGRSVSLVKNHRKNSSAQGVCRQPAGKASIGLFAKYLGDSHVNSE